MKFRSEKELIHIRAAWAMNSDGKLIWARDAHKKKKDDLVGLTTLKSGHQNCFLTFEKKLIGYSVGQIAWFLYHNEWATQEIDHIDGNPQNNLKINLRQVNRSQQCQNRKAGIRNRPNKGVYKRNYGDRWAAQIWVGSKCINLGTFGSELEAVLARKRAALELHGAYANLRSYI
jgi:hypothetical protein